MIDERRQQSSQPQAGADSDDAQAGHRPTGVAIVLSHGSSFRGIRLAERSVRTLGSIVQIG